MNTRVRKDEPFFEKIRNSLIRNVGDSVSNLLAILRRWSLQGRVVVGNVDAVVCCWSGHGGGKDCVIASRRGRLLLVEEGVKVAEE